MQEDGCPQIVMTAKQNLPENQSDVPSLTLDL